MIVGDQQGILYLAAHASPNPIIKYYYYINKLYINVKYKIKKSRKAEM